MARRPSLFSKYELPNEVLNIAVPVPQTQEQRGEVQRDNSQKRLQQHPQERLQLRNSGNRQRLQNVWQKRQSAFDRRTYDLIYVVDSSDQERIEEPTIRRLWKYIKRSPISDRVQ